MSFIRLESGSSFQRFVNAIGSGRYRMDIEQQLFEWYKVESDNAISQAVMPKFSSHWSTRMVRKNVQGLRNQRQWYETYQWFGYQVPAGNNPGYLTYLCECPTQAAAKSCSKVTLSATAVPFVPAQAAAESGPGMTLNAAAASFVPMPKYGAITAFPLSPSGRSIIPYAERAAPAEGLTQTPLSTHPSTEDGADTSESTSAMKDSSRTSGSPPTHHKAHDLGAKLTNRLRDLCPSTRWPKEIIPCSTGQYLMDLVEWSTPLPGYSFRSDESDFKRAVGEPVRPALARAMKERQLDGSFEQSLAGWWDLP